MDERPGEHPLNGIRVLDLSRGVAAAYAARLLAAWGAYVLKVEPPAGDPLREDAAGLFVTLHGDKRSLTLDLARPEGASLLRALILDYDVLIEDYAPGELDRLGAGYATLAALKPRLVQLSVTAFGLHGPLAGRDASDAELFAAAGLEGPASGSSGAQFRAGLHAFAAVTTALYSAQVTEVGRQVEAATIETLAATLPKGARAVSAGASASGGGSPFLIDGIAALRGPAPQRGEHTEEVLFGELETEPAEFARLRALGVV